MRLKVIIISVIATALLSISQRSGALEIDDRARIPLVVVNAGNEVSDVRVENLVKVLDVPILDGEALARELSLDTPASAQLPDSIRQDFKAAQDMYFDGNAVGARELFERVVSEVTQNPQVFNEETALRELVFKANIHLGVIANRAGDAEKQSEHFRIAALMFPDLEPTTQDFPPAEVKEIMSIRGEQSAETGHVEFSPQSDCTLMLSGRRMEYKAPLKVPFGEYSALLDCQGKTSEAKKLVIHGESTEFVPVFFNALKIENTAKQFRMKTSPETTDDEIVHDLLSLLRGVSGSRMVVIVGRSDEIEMWLVDAQAGGTIRTTIIGNLDDMASIPAGTELLVEQPLASGSKATIPQRQKWYTDGLAWTLVGTGIAVFGLGVALGQVYGTPSAEETWAWAAMMAGAGIAGTGVVLFFIPENTVSDSVEDGFSSMSPGIAVRGVF